MQSALVGTLWLLVVAIVPVALFAWIIHLLERLIQTRLARRFGWNSVLWTGWLGTPVHELSHAVMCVLFGHRIVDMALFEPDKVDGRLGYVTHVWTRGNLYQEIGGFFIGIAPLIGGTLAMTGMLLVFYPDAGFSALAVTDPDAPFWGCVQQILSNLFAGLFSGAQLASFKLWIFLYLLLCIGTHMGPSEQDYRGAVRGGIMVFAVLALVCFGLVLTGVSTVRPVLVVALAPLVALMLATTLLCTVAGLGVGLLTALYDRLT